MSWAVAAALVVAEKDGVVEDAVVVEAAEDVLVKDGPACSLGVVGDVGMMRAWKGVGSPACTLVACALDSEVAEDMAVDKLRNARVEVVASVAVVAFAVLFEGYRRVDWECRRS